MCVGGGGGGGGRKSVYLPLPSETSHLATVAIYDYTRRSSLDFFTLTATVHRKVELFFIWAQVALCKLTISADLTVVKTPNTIAPSWQEWRNFCHSY